MRNSYRIVGDNRRGYEVQIKLWWFPVFWFECNSDDYYSGNSHYTLEKAEVFARKHAEIGKVEKYLGKLP